MYSFVCRSVIFWLSVYDCCSCLRFYVCIHVYVCTVCIYIYIYLYIVYIHVLYIYILTVLVGISALDVEQDSKATGPPVQGTSRNGKSPSSRSKII